MRFLILALRFAIGALFLFSGIIKAVDPLGFSYKLDEYFIVFKKYSALSWMSADIFSSHSLELGIIMCILEVFLGFALIFGAWFRFTVITSLALMIFFTFLTGFSAITDSVKDCGCFGDAIKLTPWQSFTKDVVLTILLLPLLSRKLTEPTTSFPKFSQIATVLGAIISIAVPVYCLLYLPLIDFRAYKIGNNICELRELPADAKKPIVEMTFVYKDKATGKEVEFTTEQVSTQDLSNYEFVDRYDKVIQEGDMPKIPDFGLQLANGQDVTDFFLQSKGYKLVVVAYNLDKTRLDDFADLKVLASELEKMGVPTYGLTSSPDQQTEEFRHANQLAFPFFYSDNVPLKTMIRSNPGLILMQDCTVKMNWPGRALPSVEELKALVEQQELPNFEAFAFPDLKDANGTSIKMQLYGNDKPKIALVYGAEAMSEELKPALIAYIQQARQAGKEVLILSAYINDVPAELIQSLGATLVEMAESDIQDRFNIDSGVLSLSPTFTITESKGLNDF